MIILSYKYIYIYIYTFFLFAGQIEVNSETCQELMSAADMFNVSEVLVFCCEFLKQQLTVENCIGKCSFN